MRQAILLAAVVLAGCTVIKINKGDTNTIEHNAGQGVAQNLTGRACYRAGGQVPEIISTVNKDAQLPPGTGKQVTTFRCKAPSR